MAIRRDESFYQKLTRLFRTGPAIKQKIRGQDPKNFYDKSISQNNLGYYGASAFKRESSPFSTMGAYGLLDRASRYAEFQEMEYTSEVASALDIYADESCASDEDGRSLHIFTDNRQIRKALEELFYETCNVELDMRRWIRNLVKYGDFFLYNEVVPDQGIIHVEPIPVNLIEREESFDPTDPYAVRFKILSHGGKILENWQVTHFRLQGNELFHPYGTSFLEAARRTWRQLIMMEDAMLVYRVVRSPERRVFYIDVTGINPNDVPTYMETVTQAIKGQDVVERMSGRMDLRYNAIDVNEDYFLPTRPNNLTKIDTLAGGQHVSAIEDVEYIQKKLFAALKVPKAYLTYDENLSCLTGDTLIPLLSGEKITIKELADKFNNGTITEEWVYSTKLNGKIVPGKVTKAWETKKVDSLYKVYLDNGEVISCTENHPFLLRSGVYKRADELNVNDSLMPVYRKLSSKKDGDRLDGYEMIFDNNLGEWIYTHKIVNDEIALQTGGHTIKKQRVIHHKDFNKLNNAPTNLQEMTWYSHRKLHSENIQTTLLRPDVLIKREPLRLAALASSKHRQQKSKQMKLQMADPKSKIRLWIQSNELKQVVSANMKDKWKNIEYRSLKTKQNKEILSRPEVKQKLSGDNHWATKQKKNYDLNWLIDYCKANNVTNLAHFKYSKKHDSPIGFRTLQYIFKENNIKGWRQFEKNFLKKNHSVLKIEIERCNDSVPVYDLEVENTHNFLVEQGVVLHNSKATLAQEDIRFSRTIATLQKVVIAELSKIAIIHLFAKGFEGEDLLDFELRLSNPSTIATQQKLQLLISRLEAAGKAQELAKETTLISEEWIQKEILKFRADQIAEIRQSRFEDQLRFLKLTKMAPPPDEKNAIVDPFDRSNYNKINGVPVAKEVENELMNTIDQEMDNNGTGPTPSKNLGSSVDAKKAPIKANPTPNLDNAARKRERSKEFSGDRALATPNFKNMLDVGNRYTKDPFDTKSTKNFTFMESKFFNRNEIKIPNLSKDIQSSLTRFYENAIKKNQILDIDFVNEAVEVQIPEEEQTFTVSDLLKCFDK